MPRPGSDCAGMNCGCRWSRSTSRPRWRSTTRSSTRGCCRRLPPEMAEKSKKAGMVTTGTVDENRRARFDYEILDTLEAGIVLTGTEVKSLRQGKAQITESYASPERGELWLINAHIPEYLQA